MKKNPVTLLRLKRMWSGFANRHPKLLRYMFYISDNALQEGSVLDITVTDAAGNPLHANARLTAEDVAFFQEIRAVLGS